MAVRRGGKKAIDRMRSLRPYIRAHRLADQKFSPEKSALMVIDMQRFFLEESSHAHVPGTASVVRNIQKLLRAYRKRSLPIIHTRHALLRGESPGSMGHWWGDVLYDDDELSEIVPRLRPVGDETVIRKTRYSAFAGTGLERTLRKKRIEQLLIAGVQTHLCCETTARDAFVRDFQVFVTVDATASRTKDLSVSSLKTMTDGVAIPLTTAEVLRWFR